MCVSHALFFFNNTISKYSLTLEYWDQDFCVTDELIQPTVVTLK